MEYNERIGLLRKAKKQKRRTDIRGKRQAARKDPSSERSGRRGKTRVSKKRSNFIMMLEMNTYSGDAIKYNDEPREKRNEGSNCT